MHGDGVHDPGHDLGVRVHVGCRDVDLRTDDVTDLSSVATREVFELGPRKQLGIDGDSALGAAVGQIVDGALPGHPHGQGPHLVQRDVLVIANAALGGTQDAVVVYTVPGERTPAAVVHLHREADRELTVTAPERVSHLVVEVHAVGSGVELGHRHLERVLDYDYWGLGLFGLYHGRAPPCVMEYNMAGVGTIPHPAALG